jgi:hypothetical protein
MDNIKLLLGIADTSKDALLTLLTSIAEDEVKAYCNIVDIPANLGNVIAEIVVIKYNRIGSEGIASQNFSGAAESFTDSYPASVLAALQRYRRVKFL